MSSDLAIRVEGLSKAYTIRHNQTDHVTLAEVALHRLAHPLRRAETERFLALDDVSFEVERGEVLGLIGRNGAGKSTLLKVLSRITEPTHGRIDLWGRVGSLLEVGTGFHPELTGRENVYLNGSILGMTRKEIDRQFDAIVDFAGVEKFLDTPVKRYSSGMYVRLAFAVAAHLETEILLLDEVLAVGDGEFQKKCLGKVSDLARSGRTVILVSHNIGAVSNFTTSALLLTQGRVEATGPTDDVVAGYLNHQGSIVEEVDVSHLKRVDAAYGSRSRILRVRLDHPNGLVDADGDLRFSIDVSSTEDIDDVRVGQNICTEDGTSVGTSYGPPTIQLRAGRESRISVVVPNARLSAGRYYLAISIGFGDRTTGIDDLDVVLETVHFEVAPEIVSGTVVPWERHWGLVRLEDPIVEQVTYSTTG